MPIFGCAFRTISPSKSFSLETLQPQRRNTQLGRRQIGGLVRKSAVGTSRRPSAGGPSPPTHLSPQVSASIAPRFPLQLPVRESDHFTHAQRESRPQLLAVLENSFRLQGVGAGYSTGAKSFSIKPWLLRSRKRPVCSMRSRRSSTASAPPSA